MKKLLLIAGLLLVIAQVPTRAEAVAGAAVAAIAVGTGILGLVIGTAHNHCCCNK